VSEPVERALCGPYELVAQRPGSLAIGPGNTVELFAEDWYLVKLGAGADPDALREALSVPHRGAEGRLRFANFIGNAELGGRSLLVRSRRLKAAAVERMLDDVCGWLSSLPFAAATPVRTTYTRSRDAGPQVLYHVFALLRDAFRGIGPHSLEEALERVLAQPHESLLADVPRLVPIGAASRVEPETLNSIPALPELLNPVSPQSPLARTPLAKRLGGQLPEEVKVRPFLHSTDNPENRFVCGVLDTMIELLRRFERIARAEARASAVLNIRDSQEIVAYLRRCRHHRVLAHLRPRFELPPHSAVLRSRPGYRQLLNLHSDLQGRSRAAPHDAQRLLESRDAATLYEYWCFVRIVDRLEELLGLPLSRDRFKASPLGTELNWGYRVSWGEVTAVYNASFSRPAGGDPRPGLDSYSLRLRPDIVLKGPDGRLNLFDAKLKLRFLGALATTGVEPGGTGPEETFKPEDLHKMHAYRDALGAESVWVLYPGSATRRAEFAAPPRSDDPLTSRFQGVGAISLNPGAEHDGGLRELLRSLT
jgi:predicted component of viral defense system (DUF524 family)